MYPAFTTMFKPMKVRGKNAYVMYSIGNMSGQKDIPK